MWIKVKNRIINLDLIANIQRYTGGVYFETTNPDQEISIPCKSEENAIYLFDQIVQVLDDNTINIIPPESK